MNLVRPSARSPSHSSPAAEYLENEGGIYSLKTYEAQGLCMH